MTAPAHEFAAALGTAGQAVAPIEDICERAGHWRLIDVDCWIYLSDPDLDRWTIWRRVSSDRKRARREPGDYIGADAAARAARGM